MSEGNIFGTIVTGKDVEDAVTGTIKLFIRDYLAEIAERSGRDRGDLPAFKSYVPLFDLDKFAEDQVPACVIMAPGTLDNPSVYRQAVLARWSVGIGCVISGQDRENTRELAQLYAAAVRSLLVHNGSLGGFADGIALVAERYDNLPTEAWETLGAGVVQISVDVNNINDVNAGPREPSLDPITDPGVVPEVETTVTEIGPMWS